MCDHIVIDDRYQLKLIEAFVSWSSHSMAEMAFVMLSLMTLFVMLGTIGIAQLTKIEAVHD